MRARLRAKWSVCKVSPAPSGRERRQTVDVSARLVQNVHAGSAAQHSFWSLPFTEGSQTGESQWLPMQCEPNAVDNPR